MATQPPPLVISSEEGYINPVPAYTETYDNQLYTRIAESKALELPILHGPEQFIDINGFRYRERFNRPGTPDDNERQAERLSYEVVQAFFDAVHHGHDDIVNEFVSRGFVSPDVTRREGEMPLYAAVTAGRTPMVSTLVALGATVNAFSTVEAADGYRVDGKRTFTKRTPLMRAAEKGHLALVKVLMEDYGADDGIVAPDGAIALRLAAQNGHRDVVNYLPARRDGTLLRWKAAHMKELKRLSVVAKNVGEFIVFVLWDLPKMLVYDLPKRVCQGVWRRRHRIAAWCKRLPTMIKKGVLELPKNVKHWIKEISRTFKCFVKEVWGAIKGLPKASKTALIWIGQGLKSAGQSVLHIITRFLSWIHTAVSAAISFFREITLEDVWNGFCQFLAAIFVDAPKVIWGFVRKFGEVSYKVMKQLFGCTGKIIWFIGKCLFDVVKYVPERLAGSIVRLVRAAYIEIMSTINPKRV